MAAVRFRKRSRSIERKTRDDRKLNQNKSLRNIVLVFAMGFTGWFIRQKFQANNETNNEHFDPLSSPLNAPSAVKSIEGLGNHNYLNQYWGTYRSGYYLGMKTKSANSLIAGFMWMEQYVDLRNVPGDVLRHKCNQDNRLKYGWKSHDGDNFGHQTIEEQSYDISTKFLKRFSLGENGGDWSWRIDATNKRNDPKLRAVTFLVYFAIDQDGSLQPFVDGTNSNKLRRISGQTSTLGEFNIRFLEKTSKVLSYFSYKTDVSSLSDIHEDALGRISGQMVDVENEQKPYFYFQEKNEQKSSSKTGRELIAFIVTGELPLRLEVLFESKSGDRDRFNSLKDATFDDEFRLFKNKFDQDFAASFNLASKWRAPHINFGKAALSNMLGGIGYFYGHSKIQRNNEPVENSFEAPLFTGVPSRSFFPRGFLWDEGFHQILISKFKPHISNDVIAHWLDLLNADGWIPREVILDDEARSRVPSEFIVQKNDRANPPTFFLAIDSLIKNEQITDNELHAIYPRLVAWFNWYNTTQYGPIVYTYQWKGRFINDQNSELNPKTLTSGLDDYPRASHPSEKEYHLDLRCWIGLAAQVLADISKKLGKADSHFVELASKLKDFNLLNKLHWDEERKIYSDYGLDSSDVRLKKVRYLNDEKMYDYKMVRQVITPPVYKFVNHSGYVSLFPLIMKLIDPDSSQLSYMLEFIRNEKKLWTQYGLRSLSKDDLIYDQRNTEHDPPYWRGNIWININFLTVKALQHYASVPGSNASRAEEILNELKNNIVMNVFNQFQNTGFIWENYNDLTGAGQGCHPFTGWSSLTLLMME